MIIFDKFEYYLICYWGKLFVLLSISIIIFLNYYTPLNLWLILTILLNMLEVLLDVLCVLRLVFTFSDWFFSNLEKLIIKLISWSLNILVDKTSFDNNFISVIWKSTFWHLWSSNCISTICLTKNMIFHVCIQISIVLTCLGNNGIKLGHSFSDVTFDVGSHLCF